MTPLNLKLARIKHNTFRSTLESASSADKTKNISSHLGEEFNQLLDDVRALNAEVAAGLPKNIVTKTPLNIGKLPLTFLDLEILVNQVGSILELLDDM